MPEWMNIPALADEQPEKQIHIARYTYAASVLKGKRVLDCACGMGYGTEILSRDCDVIGMDIDPEAIGLARQQYPELAFEVGDIYNSDGSAGFGCDTLVSFETLEHLDKPEEVIDHLPENITEIIVSAPIRPTVGWNKWHRTDFTHGTLCQMVERVFRIVNVMGQPWVDGKGDLYLLVHGKRGKWVL